MTTLIDTQLQNGSPEIPFGSVAFVAANFFDDFGEVQDVDGVSFNWYHKDTGLQFNTGGVFSEASKYWKSSFELPELGYWIVTAKSQFPARVLDSIGIFCVAESTQGRALGSIWISAEGSALMTAAGALINATNVNLLVAEDAPVGTGKLVYSTPGGQTKSLLIQKIFDAAAAAVNLEVSDLVDEKIDEKVDPKIETAKQDSNTAYKYKSKDALATTVARSNQERVGDKLNASDFGFVTTDTADSMAANNAAITAMLAEIARRPDQRLTVEFKRGDRIRFSNRNITLPAMRLITNGAKFIYERGPGRETLFNLADGFIGDSLDILCRPGFGNYRAVRVGDVAAVEGVKLDYLRFVSESQVPQPSGSTRYDVAFLLHGALRLGTVEVVNHDMPYTMGGETTVQEDIRIGDLRATSYKRGVGVDNVRDAKVLSSRVKVRSPNALADPGNNAWLIMGAEDLEISHFNIADSGEHGLRFGSPSTGTFKNRRVKISHGTIARPGQTGLKIWDADNSALQDGITLLDISVFDAGNWNTSKGELPAYNDFGFMLQNVKNLTAMGLKVYTQDSQYCARDGIYMASLINALLEGVYVENPRYACMWLDGYNGQDANGPQGARPMSDVTVRGAHLRNPGTGSASILVREAPGFVMNNLDIEANIRGGSYAVQWQGDGAGAVEKSIFVVKALDVGGIYSGPAKATIIAKDKTA